MKSGHREIVSPTLPCARVTKRARQRSRGNHKKLHWQSSFSKQENVNSGAIKNNKEEEWGQPAHCLHFPLHSVAVFMRGGFPAIRHSITKLGPVCTFEKFIPHFVFKNVEKTITTNTRRGFPRKFLGSPSALLRPMQVPSKPDETLYRQFLNQNT